MPTLIHTTSCHYDSTRQHTKVKHSRLGAKGPPLVGEEVRKRVGT
jgi:hypothetical protein